MKLDEYLKKMGRIKISEDCNWDLNDIRHNISRIANIAGSRLSNAMKPFKALFAEKTEIYRKDPLLIEIIEKLKGE